MSPTQGTAQPRRVYANGKVKRQEIIQAAIGLFAEVGFNAASLRDIAARAGLSHPGLLHHFPTKAVLLAGVLEHRDEVDGAALEEEVALGRSRLEAMVRLVERNQLRRPIIELFATLSGEATSPDHPAHAYFVRRYESTTADLAAQFERHAATGTLRAGVTPDGAARTMVAVMDGLQIQWLMSLGADRSHQVDMADDLRAYLATVVDGSL